MSGPQGLYTTSKEANFYSEALEGHGLFTKSLTIPLVQDPSIADTKIQ